MREIALQIYQMFTWNSERVHIIELFAPRKKLATLFLTDQQQ